MGFILTFQNIYPKFEGIVIMFSHVNYRGT